MPHESEPVHLVLGTQYRPQGKIHFVLLYKMEHFKLRRTGLWITPLLLHVRGFFCLLNRWPGCCSKIFIWAEVLVLHYVTGCPPPKWDPTLNVLPASLPTEVLLTSAKLWTCESWITMHRGTNWRDHKRGNPQLSWTVESSNCSLLHFPALWWLDCCLKYSVLEEGAEPCLSGCLPLLLKGSLLARAERPPAWILEGCCLTTRIYSARLDRPWLDGYESAL